MIITIYSLLFIIICLVLYNLFIDIDEKLFYENSLDREKMISRLSEIRMRIMQMVHLGEIDPNSKYFVFIYASCSHLIRIIYKHKIDRVTLEKYNLLKKLYEELNCKEKEKFCDDVYNEINSLNNEHKMLLTEVSAFIIASYTVNYWEKIVYSIAKFIILRFKDKIISIKNHISDRFKQKIPIEIKIKYETAKTFDNELRAVLC